MLAQTQLDSFEKKATFWSRDTVKLYDFFEPADVRPALELTDCNLGRLIFGDKEWSRLQGFKSPRIDPLTAMFQRRGMFSHFCLAWHLS